MLMLGLELGLKFWAKCLKESCGIEKTVEWANALCPHLLLGFLQFIHVIKFCIRICTSYDLQRKKELVFINIYSNNYYKKIAFKNIK